MTTTPADLIAELDCPSTPASALSMPLRALTGPRVLS
jgi:hypothetical protein